MIYQHPLAYLIGLEGIALLRGWAGDYDETFVRERLAEVRRLVADEGLAEHAGVRVSRGESAAGYRQWADSYDEPRNSLFDYDEPVVFRILDDLPAGTALDAACGTGRFSEALAERGHRVLGVDSSPEMLSRARRRVPGAAFCLGELDRLPLSDDAVDLVVCGLAMSHLPSLGPAMAELARVLRPGGHLVISDVHHELIFRGSVVHALGASHEPGLVPTYRHSIGDFLRAALPLGLAVRRCEEPLAAVGDGEDGGAAMARELVAGPWAAWPWSLLDLVPGAARAAWTIPLTVIWHFQLEQP